MCVYIYIYIYTYGGVRDPNPKDNSLIRRETSAYV